MDKGYCCCSLVGWLTAYYLMKSTLAFSRSRKNINAIKSSPTQLCIILCV